jgi:hypothetical protein
MSKRPQHLDYLLSEWAFAPGQVLVRQIQGEDGRDLLQMRIDLGILQMETKGRPDGVMPEGFETFYDYLVSLAFAEGQSFQLDDERCTQIDREFYQYYHRRICWLTLKKYAEVVEDAKHTLSLMDFSTSYAPDPEWADLHEQFRPFVMFHEIQASALLNLEENEPQSATETIDKGLQSLAEVFEKLDATEFFDEDGFVIKLREMHESIIEHYELDPSLAEQLAEAITAEQYELAAELRDRMERQSGGN